MKQLKLWWSKWQLKRAYYELVRLENQADCGHALLKYVWPAYADQRDKVDRLFAQCKAIEFNHPKNKERGVENARL